MTHHRPHCQHSTSVLTSGLSPRPNPEGFWGQELGNPQTSAGLSPGRTKRRRCQGMRKRGRPSCHVSLQEPPVLSPSPPPPLPRGSEGVIYVHSAELPFPAALNLPRTAWSSSGHGRTPQHLPRTWRGPL